MLGHVLRRIQEFNSNLGKEPLPGLMIMCGDFHQITPVSGMYFYTLWTESLIVSSLCFQELQYSKPF